MNNPSLQVRETRLWYAGAGRGVIAAIFGMLLMSSTYRSIGAIAGIFAAYLIVDGVLSLYIAWRAKQVGWRSWAALFVGVIDVAAAVVALVIPTMLVLRLVGGLRAIISGSGDAFSPHHQHQSELLSLGGVVAVILGILILVWPGPTTVALPWLLGLEAMVSGALFVAGAASEIKRASEAIVPHAA
jgi:succinate dehydrogenase/fumarate reductase cytochrome b subunit